MADLNSPKRNAFTPASARSSTLPSVSASQPQPAVRHSTDAPRHHRHHTSHRHNRSHQIHTREPQSAFSRSSSSQPTDRFKPVRSVAGGLRDLGSRATAPHQDAAAKQLGKQKVVGEGEVISSANEKDIRADVPSWEDVKREQFLNQERQKALSASFFTLTTRALEYASSLARTHAALKSSIASSSLTISHLSSLLSSTTSLLTSFTSTDIPELESSTRAQITALERTFGVTETQRIADLETRVATAREKMLGLRTRLASCRERVAREEAREQDERRRHRRTMSLAWGALGFALLLFVATLVWRNWTEAAVEATVATGMTESLPRKGKSRELLRAKLVDQGMEWVLDNDADTRAASRHEGTRTWALGASGNSRLVDPSRVTFRAGENCDADDVLARMFDGL